MPRGAALLLAPAVALAACGTPPNQTLLTRAGTYLRAMSLTAETGYPLDIAELERKFPELKGVVITAAQWIEEYARLDADAKKRGEPLIEFRIPFGARIRIEVTGEPQLSRDYSIPPSGFVHYPYVTKLRVAGLTIDELKQRLERDLSPYLKSPEVLVHVMSSPVFTQPDELSVQPSFGAQDIVVMGAARSRFFTNFAYTGKETLMTVLGRSGLPDDVEWRQVRVIRRSIKDPLRKSRIIVCDLWDYFAKGDVRQDIPLVPGDVVYVPLRWSVDDQFWDDWTYVKRIMSDIFFLDSFRDGLKQGGTLRQ